MPHPEQQPEQHIYQSEQFIADITETPETLTTTITHGTEIVIFRYTPPGHVAVELLQGEHASLLPAPAMASEQPTQDRKETEPAVRLFGRTATDPFAATAPSGDAMLIVSFAEHPSWNHESLSNSHATYTKNDTRYWQAAAIGEYRQLLEGLPKGKACILIGYPKEFKKQGKAGKEETVKNGFQIVSLEPYRGFPKPR